MPPLPDILNEFIIKTKEKLNSSNLKVLCKCCIEALGEEALGEEEGGKNFFPNKKDRIILHLKKCTHFYAKTTPEKRNEIFLLARGNDIDELVNLGKRRRKDYFNFKLILFNYKLLTLILLFYSFIYFLWYCFYYL